MDLLIIRRRFSRITRLLLPSYVYTPTTQSKSTDSDNHTENTATGLGVLVEDMAKYMARLTATVSI